MKYLLKLKESNIKSLKDFFITKNAFNVGKDLVTAGGSTHKFVTLDTSSHSISLFNKVAEEKIRAIKISLEDATVKKVTYRFLLDFMENIDKFNYTSISNSSSGIVTIDIISYDEKAKNPVNLDLDAWHIIPMAVNNESILVNVISNATLPEFDKAKKSIAFLGKKPGIAIMEMNYAFCDEKAANSREVFGSIEVFSSKLFPDLMFCDFETLVKEFGTQDLKKHIYSELVDAPFNEQIKKIMGDDCEVVLVGLCDEQGRTAWIPWGAFLEYLDISDEIFRSCFDKIADKKTEVSFEIPSLESFPTETVKNLKIYLENKSYLYNFANILEMRSPSLCLETGLFEEPEDYGFNF